jgi:hypothetical protein
MRNLLLGLLAAAVLAITAGTAFADDWTVTRLRGTVEQMIDGQWQPLERGSVVPDTRKIFTRSNGHATLVRGNEAIELGPNTQIEIHDQGGRKPFTTILQYAGVLTVEAEVRNVQHFAVRTAYLAAVVKGTRFTVTARSNGGSVEVERGQVSVENEQNDEAVLIVAGQKAKVAKGGGLTVSGKPKAGAKPAAAAKSTGQGKPDKTGKSDAADDTPSPGKSGDKTEKAAEKAADKLEKASEKTADKVENVVNKTASTVNNVVDTTTDVVDQVAGTVDNVTGTNLVGNTVGTVTNTLDKTTGALTGLLGKKKNR